MTAINNLSNMKISPFELVYGRQPRLPTSILEPDDAEFTADFDEYNTRHVYEYDRRMPGHAKDSEFAVGDEVMLYSPRLRTTEATASEVACRKLQPRWNGPFTIVQISNTDDVITIRDSKGRLLRVKLHDLKTYHTPVAGDEGLLRVTSDLPFLIQTDPMWWQRLSHTAIKDGKFSIESVGHLRSTQAGMTVRYRKHALIARPLDRCPLY